MEDELDKMPDNPFEWLKELPEEDVDDLFSDVDLYEFEFIFLPKLAATEWVDDSSRKTCLSDTVNILEIADEQGLNINPLNFSATIHHTENLEVYVYDFPLPPRLPLAYYGVLINGDKGMKYYTLEKSFDGCMFCSPSPEIHENFGFVEMLGKDEFIKLAMDHYMNEA